MRCRPHGDSFPPHFMRLVVSKRPNRITRQSIKQLSKARSEIGDGDPESPNPCDKLRAPPQCISLHQLPGGRDEPSPGTENKKTTTTWISAVTAERWKRYVLMDVGFAVLIGLDIEANKRTSSAYRSFHDFPQEVQCGT